MSNPYTLVFGKEPLQLISRASQSTKVIETFNSETPSQQTYMITGVRGSGKTVFMNEISTKLAKEKNWITVELSSNTDLLESLASKLASDAYFAKIFQQAKINLSFWGIGLTVDGTAPITNIEVALEKIISSLSKKGKKLLITIDEVTNNEYMRVFASAFQILIRKNLPVFLLMTGLYENINSLQNEKNLTFLYRMPRIELKPLNIRTISENYKKTFNIDSDLAMKMAKLTRGYSFAFQVMGYFFWENGKDLDNVMGDYRDYLEEYVYDKVWAEMSPGDRKIALGIANCPNGRIKDIREYLDIQTNEFNPYRKRLIKKGIVNGDERGYVKFTLPLFEEYVIDNYA